VAKWAEWEEWAEWAARRAGDAATLGVCLSACLPVCLSVLPTRLLISEIVWQMVRQTAVAQRGTHH
jgi:hypothetical protein